MRILFVEGDMDLRAFYGSKLRDEFTGTIDLVATSKEGIKLLRSDRPYDVIISEYHLNKGTGADVLHFKTKNKIGGAFLFFCTIKEDHLSQHKDFQLFDKFDFGSLCAGIKRAKVSL